MSRGGWVRRGKVLLVAMAAGACGDRKASSVRPEPAVVVSGSASQASAAAMARTAASAAASAAAMLQGESVREVRWEQGGQRLLVVSEHGVRWLDPRTGQRVDVLTARAPLHAAVMPSGEKLALDLGDAIVVHRTADGQRLVELRAAPADEAQAIEIARDGLRVVAAGQRLRLWSLPEGKLELDVENPQGMLGQAVFHEDGRHLVLASSSSATVFDLQQKAVVGEPHDTGTTATFATMVSPDGKWVAAASDAGHTMNVWKTTPWKLVRTLARVESCQHHLGVEFRNEGRTVRVVSYDAWERDYEVGSFRPAPPRAGELTVETDDKGQGRVRDARTRAVVATLSGPVEGELSLSGDGQFVAEARSREVVLRSARDGRVVSAP